MKKRSFLSPMAVSVAALISSPSGATQEPAPKVPAALTAEALEQPSTLAGLVLERSAAGQIKMAQHSSHSSHSSHVSHASHSSHSSHYSGY